FAAIIVSAAGVAFRNSKVEAESFCPPGKLRPASCRLKDIASLGKANRAVWSPNRLIPETAPDVSHEIAALCIAASVSALIARQYVPSRNSSRRRCITAPPGWIETLLAETPIAD